jgi:hypothetical protein
MWVTTATPVPVGRVVMTEAGVGFRLLLEVLTDSMVAQAEGRGGGILEDRTIIMAMVPTIGRAVCQVAAGALVLLGWEDIMVEVPAQCMVRPPCCHLSAVPEVVVAVPDRTITVPVAVVAAEL